MENRIPEIVSRLSSLEQQMAQHLKESLEVYRNITTLQTDVVWIKWIAMGILGGTATVVLQLLKK